MNKFKEFCKKVWDNILLILGGLVVVLLYVLNSKNKKINALKAEAELVETEEEVKELEYEIKALREKDNLLENDKLELDQALDMLNKRKQEISKSKKRNKKEVEDYWNEK